MNTLCHNEQPFAAVLYGLEWLPSILSRIIPFGPPPPCRNSNYVQLGGNEGVDEEEGKGRSQGDTKVGNGQEMGDELEKTKEGRLLIFRGVTGVLLTMWA